MKRQGLKRFTRPFSYLFGQGQEKHDVRTEETSVAGDRADFQVPDEATKGSAPETSIEKQPPNLEQAKRARIFLMGATPSLATPNMQMAYIRAAAEDAADKLRQTGGNTGNQIIAFGLLQALDYEAVSWDYGVGAEKVNADYDVIVIAAANFLHTGFDFGGMASFIEATNLPCVMVGVGAQSNDYLTNIPLKPGTERLMRVVAERTRLIGARGPFSADVLAHMGIHNVQVTGCPSFYMGGKPSLTVRKPELTPNARLLINSSRDVVRHAFDRDHMINIVCDLVAVAIERGADFMAQSELPEMRIANCLDETEFERNFQEIMTEFPFYERVAAPDRLRHWFRTHMRVCWDVPGWQEEMSRYDFVLGNRFHGSMIALQAGTPACVICHDTRTSEMCDFLSMPSVALKDIDRVDVDALYDRVDPVAIQARYGELYPDYKSFLHKNGLQTNLQ